MSDLTLRPGGWCFAYNSEKDINPFSSHLVLSPQVQYARFPANESPSKANWAWNVTNGNLTSAPPDHLFLSVRRPHTPKAEINAVPTSQTLRKFKAPLPATHIKVSAEHLIRTPAL
jgi:hypothetical protein